jgi:hypothetical protein
MRKICGEEKNMIVDNLATSPISLLKLLLQGKTWDNDGIKVVVNRTDGKYRVCSEAVKYTGGWGNGDKQKKEVVNLRYDITLEQFLNAAPNLMEGKI